MPNNGKVQVQISIDRMISKKALVEIVRKCPYNLLIYFDFPEKLNINKVIDFDTNLPKNVPNHYSELYPPVPPKEIMLRILFWHIF